MNDLSSNGKMDTVQKELESARSIALSSDWRSFSRPEFAKWFSELRNTLGTVDGEYERSLDAIVFSPTAIGPLVGRDVWEESFRQGIKEAARLIDTAITQIESQRKNDKVVKHQVGSPDAKERKKIFIVHGHDDVCRLELERFVERLQFEPIVLAEQASGGLVLIEKLESYADVVYTIILLTPDDVGRSKFEIELNPRARQNVILELGYFMGSLGRGRVCAMMRDKVEIPSDILGLAYIPFDPQGGWKIKLVREFKRLGLEVDANLAM